MKRAVIVVIVLIVVLGLILLSGRYNVAASERGSDPFDLILGFTAERSIAHHAGDVVVPEGPPADLAEGARHFAAMCELCHGAPGVERSSIGQGLNPEPPDLVEEAGEWGPAELFWISKHGIKMTGMPGFGATHGDEELWGVVRFVEALPGMTAEEYRQLRGEPGVEAHH